MKKRIFFIGIAAVLVLFAFASCAPFPVEQRVSKKDAQLLVADYFGLDLESCTVVKTEYDDGKYEIELVFAGNEYEAEVDVATRAVSSADIDGDGAFTPRDTAPAEELIGESRAKEIALSHLNLDAAKCSYVGIEYDEGEYEIEVRCDGREYDVTVNARTGSVIEADID